MILEKHSHICIIIVSTTSNFSLRISNIKSKLLTLCCKASVPSDILHTADLWVPHYQLTFSEKECSNILWLTFYMVKNVPSKNWGIGYNWPTLSDTASNLSIITCTPPDGWWIIIRALGRECLIPGAPAANSRLAMLHAWPTHHVAIGGRMYCMVS